MKKGWKLKTLKDVGKIFNGNSINPKIKKEKYLNQPEGLPYIATKDISYDSSINYDNGVKIPSSKKELFRIAPKNSVLMCAEGGSAGRKIGLINQDVCFVNKLFAITPENETVSKYLFYWYKSDKFKVEFNSRLTGLIGGVSKKNFETIPIPFPDNIEQEYIVKKLDACMEQIDKAIQNVEHNIHNVEELFQSQLNEVLSSNKDGWIEKKLGEVCKLITKGTTPTSVGYKFIDEGINFVKAESIALDGSFIKTKFAHISIDCHNNLKRSQLKEGDIIFSIAGVLGRTAIVTDEILPANTNQALSILRLNNDVDIDVEYLHYALSNKDALEQVKNYGGGTAQQNLSLTQMKSFKLTFPPLHIQNQIVLKLDRTKINTKLLKSNYQNELKVLNELKQSILEKAFNGEL